MRAPLRTSLLTALLLGSACAETASSLLVEPVPNPEVNTRADVTARVNSLELLLDIEGGFAGLDAEEGGSWGPYLVTDRDGDQALELVLSRPGGGRALEAFALTQGSQGDRVLTITARGYDTGRQLTALGSAAAAFEAGRQVEVELPFNLMPEYRPLRVLSMTPAQGADVAAPIESVVVQLGGYVLEEALGERGEAIELRDTEADLRLSPTATVSYIDTAMGRLTNVRLLDCELWGGSYEVVIAAGAVCTTTGQCLDQHLGLEGAQPFEGSFTVRGEARPPSCTAVEIETAAGCAEVACEPGFDCVEDTCVLNAQSLSAGAETTLLCDPLLCAPPELVCDQLGTCQADCRFFGACPSPEDRCDDERGLCERAAP